MPTAINISKCLRTSIVFLIGIAMLATTRSTKAQNSYGSIVGTVADSSGAQVPGAEVAVKNTSTNATVTTKTSSSGTYSVLNLNPGTYTVTVSLTGFKTTTRNQVDVTVGGTSRVDAALQLGDVSETVNVEAAAAPLQTDSSSLGGVVEGRQVLESPLNGRNVNNLLDFVPGVVPGGGTAGNTVANGGSGSFQVGTQTQAIAYGNYQIGGGFSGQSLFFIDGVAVEHPREQRKLAGADAGFSAGVPGFHQQCDSRVRRLFWWSRSDCDETGHQRLPWVCVRILPQHGSRR